MKTIMLNKATVEKKWYIIDAEGKALGQMKLEEAIKAARSQELDLVCVSPQAKIPVCRFMDYSKYRYEQQKRAREAKKNQTVSFPFQSSFPCPQRPRIPCQSRRTMPGRGSRPSSCHPAAARSLHLRSRYPFPIAPSSMLCACREKGY